METNAPKRRDNKKSLRVKVISLGNAEVGKVRFKMLIILAPKFDSQGHFSCEAFGCNKLSS